MRDLEVAGRAVVDSPPLAPTPVAVIEAGGRRRRRRRHATVAIALAGVVVVIGATVAVAVTRDRSTEVAVDPSVKSPVTDPQMRAHLGLDAPASWVPVDYGRARLFVPPEWKVTAGGCPGAAPGWVEVGGPYKQTCGLRQSGATFIQMFAGYSSPLDTFNQQYAALDAQRVRLKEQEQTLNDKLNQALLNNATDVGTLDAQHQAVLRQLSDLQERILRLDSTRPTATLLLARTVHGYRLYATADQPDTFTIPQLRATIHAEGPWRDAVLATLALSSEQVALTDHEPAPAGWNEVGYAGITLSVPADWPQHVGNGCGPVAPATVTLVDLEGIGCGAGGEPETGPTRDGIRIGRAMPWHFGRGNLGEVTIKPGVTSQLLQPDSNLVLTVIVQLDATNGVPVEIGLGLDGRVAAAILTSIRVDPHA